MREMTRLVQKARATLEAAQVLFDTGYFEDCISRAYYAMFHAAQAALLNEGITPKTHSGTHSLFDEHFVKRDRLPRSVARTLRQAYDARQLADYGLETSLSRETAKQVLEDAAVFLEHVASIISS